MSGVADTVAAGRRTSRRGDSTTQLTPRPSDATLTVAKAARLLGVHPNTIRTWSDQGRLRFYRINQRGDRRYRLLGLLAIPVFLAAMYVPAGLAADNMKAFPAAGAGAPCRGGRTEGVADERTTDEEQP